MEKRPNFSKLRAFEATFSAENTLSLEKRFEIANALLKHAHELGVIPGEYLLQCIEHDIARSRLLNGLSKDS